MKKTKLLALLLSLVLIVCALPMTAMAAAVTDITEVAATITAPVDGAEFDTNPKAVGENYDAISARWCKGGTVESPSDPMNPGDKFEAGKTYIVMITFATTSGSLYVFGSPLSGKINGMDATLVAGETSSFAVAFTVPSPETTVEIPFKKIVKLGGNTAPGKQAFDLEIFEVGNSSESQYTNVTYTAKVETNGKNEYAGKIVITGPTDQVENFLIEGFLVREKNSGVANWTYSDAAYKVDPVFDVDTDTLGFKYYPLKKTADYYEVEETTVNVMSFENTYTLNKVEEPKAEVKSPKTGDNSGMILLISLMFAAVAALAGTTVIGKKKQ